MNIGIDYGTTTSWIIIEEKGNVVKDLLKSSCCIMGDGKGNEVKKYGESAVQEAGSGRFIKSPKRFLVEGRIEEFYEEYGFKLEDIIEGLFFELIKRGLKQLKNWDRKSNEELVYVTVTIPNCYDGGKMKYMRSCVEGVLQRFFDDKYRLYFIPEPIAAALYCLCCEKDACVNNYGDILVCDMGGGTTDMALIKYEYNRDKERKETTFRVVATSTDATLGGDALDESLYKIIREDCKGELRSEIQTKESVTKAKEVLSTEDSYEVRYDTVTSSKRISLRSNDIKRIFSNEIELGRRFSRCMNSLVEKVRQNTEYGDLLRKSLMLLPVGGSMKIPVLRKRLKDFFSGNLIEMSGADLGGSYDSVVNGAFLYSKILQDRISTVKIKGRTLFPISIETINKCLTKIVDANMPDGEYENRDMRPSRILEDGTFEIDRLQIYYSDRKYVTDNDKGAFEVDINETFMLNNREPGDIEICLTLTISESWPVRLRVFIENIDAQGGNYDETFELRQQ